MARGMLVVFEGAEGAGKTTQVRRLVAALAAAQIPHLHQREPGGTSTGEVIRELLLSPIRTWTPAAETLLFLASRAQLVSDKILPALDRNEIVVLDRFFLSTYAYQIVGRGVDSEQVRAANQLAVKGLVPDLTILLDIPVETGLGRADARGIRDRMEQAGEEFHQKVGSAFKTFLSPKWQSEYPECGPIIRVDALGTEEEVFCQVLAVLALERPETFSGILESKLV